MTTRTSELSVKQRSSIVAAIVRGPECRIAAWTGDEAIGALETGASGRRVKRLCRRSNYLIEQETNSEDVEKVGGNWRYGVSADSRAARGRKSAKNRRKREKKGTERRGGEVEVARGTAE